MSDKTVLYNLDANSISFCKVFQVELWVSEVQVLPNIALDEKSSGEPYYSSYHFAISLSLSLSLCLCDRVETCWLQQLLKIALALIYGLKWSAWY
jgi:hypothetical protein